MKASTPRSLVSCALFATLQVFAADLQAAPCPPAEQTYISRAALDGNVIRFCVASSIEEKRTEKCFQVTNGKYTGVAAFKDQAGFGRAPFQIQGRNVKACRKQCGSFTVPGIKAATKADVTDDGSLFVVERALRESTIEFQVFDKKGLVAAFGVPVQTREASEWFIAGSSLYVRDCVGAGPGCIGRIHDIRTGKELQLIGQDKDNEYAANLYGGAELPYQSDTWAFLSAGGGEIILQNLRTGIVSRRIRARPDDVTDPEQSSRLFVRKDSLIVLHPDGHIFEFDAAGAKKAEHICK